MSKLAKIFLALPIVIVLVYFVSYKVNLNISKSIGEPIDSLNGVIIYYNGPVGNTEERNVANNGYNLGIPFQCVEFVKRYYFKHLHHEMPNSYGNAVDYFNPVLENGELNVERNLLQFKNGKGTSPQVNDLVIFDATGFNRFGHVAIVSEVTTTDFEIIQQNPGPFSPSRERFKLAQDGSWKMENDRILGFLRKAP